jgi:leucyl aminopeptidase
VVDIATLTGACVIALGHGRSGLFTPDDQLAEQLLAAGEAALDPAWRMAASAESGSAPSRSRS